MTDAKTKAICGLRWGQVVSLEWGEYWKIVQNEEEKEEKRKKEILQKDGGRNKKEKKEICRKIVKTEKRAT